MKKRQILAALLAATCAVSMAVPAFADDEAPVLGTVTNEEDKNGDDLKDWEMTVSTAVQKPTLKVTLPKSTAVLVNPYRIEIDTDGTEGTATSFDTVLSPEMEIVNNSGCAIKVGVKGMLQTYTVVSGTATALPDTTAKDASATPKALYNVTNKDNWDLSTLKYVTVGTTSVIVKEDTNSAGDSEMRQVGTFKEAVLNDDGTVKSVGSVTISGYVASKDIKVATAAIKDVDAEKTNSLFIYVEGKEENGEWATTFDAKAIAGVVDTKTKVMSKTGMMALTAKENTQNILYLGSGEKGNVRVTGQAATAPTKAWMSLTDSFETPFTFVIDAVANQAPKAPVATDIKVGGVSVTGFDPATLAYTVSANSGDGLLVVAVTAEAGATTDITASGVLTKSGSNIMMTGAGEGTVTITLTKYGLSTTYTLKVNVS